MLLDTGNRFSGGKHTMTAKNDPNSKSYMAFFVDQKEHTLERMTLDATNPR